MKRRTKKPGIVRRAGRFIIGGALNLTEDVLVETVNSVPGYPKCESYGQYCRRHKRRRRK